MATTTSVSTNFNGVVAGEIIGQAFKQTQTIKDGLVTVMPNIAYKASLRKISYANGRQDYTCGFAPAGSVTLTEKTIEPKKIMNPLSICKEDMRHVWDNASMGFSAHNDSLPKDEATALIAEILKDTAVAVGGEIWTGDSSVSGSIGGFIPLFTADSDIVKAGNGITSASAAVTKSNVVAQIEKVLDAMPDGLQGSADLVFGISRNIGTAYMQALVSAGISNGLGGADMQLMYGMYTLTIIDDLPANTFVVYEKKNLYFATGLAQDFNELKLVDEDEIGLLTGQVRGKMVYSGAVNYVNGTEIVWYLTTT